MTVFPIRFTDFHKVFAAALVLMFLAPALGRAQTADVQALVDRMDRLERDLRTLNRQQARGAVAAPSADAPSTDVAAPTAPPAPAPQVVFTEGENVLSRVLVRMDELEQEVRTATGQSESMVYNFSQLNARLDKLILDLDYRLARLEGTPPGALQASQASRNTNGTPSVSAAPAPLGVARMGVMPPVGQKGTEGAKRGTVLKNGVYQPAAQEGRILGTVAKSKVDTLAAQTQPAPADSAAPSGASGTPVATLSPAQQAAPVAAAVPDVLPAGTVSEQYKFAINLIRQARNADAEIAFKAFIQLHGDDKLAGNARYWLGETFYVRKDFMQAAQAFFEAYKKFPAGVKAPDALLKLGMSMANMDKKSEACTTYGKLRQEFGGDMRTSIKQALDRETQRLTCK